MILSCEPDRLMETQHLSQLLGEGVSRLPNPVTSHRAVPYYVPVGISLMPSTASLSR